MAKGGKRRAREEAMRAVLARWERSGLAISSFADREGIAAKTMYRWRRRFRVGGDYARRGRPPRASTARARDVARAAVPVFTEVGSALRMAGPSGMGFEVVLRSGTTVRLPERFDASALRVLLATLGGC